MQVPDGFPSLGLGLLHHKIVMSGGLTCLTKVISTRRPTRSFQVDEGHKQGDKTDSHQNQSTRDPKSFVDLHIYSLPASKTGFGQPNLRHFSIPDRHGWIAPFPRKDEECP